MNKLFLIAVAGLLLVGCVSAMTITYSNPEVMFPESHISPQKVLCDREIVNQKFEDYRNNIIPKQEMINYINGCEW